MANIEVILPQMGEGIIEATITRWLVNVNETIKEDDPLVEIATDKVDSEIPSPVTGKIIKHFFSEGETPKIGDVIAVINNGKVDDSFRERNEDEINYPVEDSLKNINRKPQIGVNATSLSNSIKLKSNNLVSPFIKFFANSRNISIHELSKMQGSGKNGQITKEDIFNYIKNGRPFRDAFDASTILRSDLIPENNPYIPKDGEEIIEIDRTRAIIAQHMVNSVQSAPHVTSFVEADITDLVTWRESIKKGFIEKHGINFTYTPIFVEVVVRCLKEFPAINSSLINNKQQLLKKHINIGIATALSNGNLVVPVIKDADKYNLEKLSIEIAKKTEKARQGKLNPGDTNGGTFTISNLGQFNTISGTPIINQPQSAILAVGAIKKKPGVVLYQGEYSIGIRDILTLSLSFDHRIIDGALGGAFLSRVGELLEKFKTTEIS